MPRVDDSTPDNRMSAMEIFQADAREWKKRALVAEAKLHGYRRLREIGDELLPILLEDRPDTNSSEFGYAVDSLRDELATLDAVDPPKDFFNQTVEPAPGVKIVVCTVTQEKCSTLDVEDAKILIRSDQPIEGKVFGLVFQMLMISDAAAAVATTGDPETATSMSPEHRNTFTASIIALLAAMDLLNPALGITATSMLEFADLKVDPQKKV